MSIYTTKFDQIREVKILAKRRNKKVTRFRRVPRLNIGGIAFLFILVYIVVTCVIYWKKPKISVYEVTEKDISNEYNCTGLILREEKIVDTPKEGYLNYYYMDGTKVPKNKVVYTIDSSGEIYNLLKNANETVSLSKSERNLLWDTISDFRKTYDSSRYNSVSDFVYGVNNTVLELSSSGMSENVEKILKENKLTDSYESVTTAQSGVICYTMDGYEDKTADDVTGKDFDLSKYEKTQIRSSEQVKKNAPAYKIITSEDWKIVLHISKELYDKLEERQNDNAKKNVETSYVKIKTTRDNLTATVPYTLSTKEKDYFAILSMNDYIVHFLNDRFLSIDVVYDSVQGLKIPTSSILEKEYYQVPKEYFTEGGDSNKKGLIKEVYDKSGDLSYSFVETSDCYEDADGMVYVSKDLFSQGEWIRNQENQERYQISAIQKLKGVYNVNYGYCVFKPVDILYKNEEYSIVKPDTENGLSNYDHIIVDASTVTEDDLINNYKSE